MPQLSGPIWINRFPTSTSVIDLSADFAASVNYFIVALEAGGASVSIAATLRPPQRAHLMHYAWKVGRDSMDPATVPEVKPPRSLRSLPPAGALSAFGTAGRH